MEVSESNSFTHYCHISTVRFSLLFCKLGGDTSSRVEVFYKAYKSISTDFLLIFSTNLTLVNVVEMVEVFFSQLYEFINSVVRWTSV